MAAGYGLGPIFKIEPGRRRGALLIVGFACCAAVGIVRALNGYGDPSPWAPQRSPVFTAISFFDTTKYPASLDFVLLSDL